MNLNEKGANEAGANEILVEYKIDDKWWFFIISILQQSYFESLTIKCFWSKFFWWFSWSNRNLIGNFKSNGAVKNQLVRSNTISCLQWRSVKSNYMHTVQLFKRFKIEKLEISLRNWPIRMEPRPIRRRIRRNLESIG